MMGSYHRYCVENARSVRYQKAMKKANEAAKVPPVDEKQAAEAAAEQAEREPDCSICAMLCGQD